MKELSLKQEIERSYSKVQNLIKAQAEIQSKINRLKDSLERLERGANNEIQRIANFGYKTPKRSETGEPVVESSEVVQKKQEYNINLYKQKLDLIRDFYPDFYQTFEKIVPDALKDVNLEEI